MLYIVSTPIGNLKDITLRAVEVLKEVDLIAAEDTRQTGKLLKHFDISTPQTSYHDHNERGKAQKLLEQMQSGKKIALVSDAGTPGISDPGYRIVKLAREEGIDVQVVPGPCAAIAALSLSGLPTDKFAFFGFLPVKPGARRKKFEEAQAFGGTVIFYESPHRLMKSLSDIRDVLDDPKVVVARELTKKFEECLTDNASVLIDHFKKKKPKGECVILLNFS